MKTYFVLAAFTLICLSPPQNGLFAPPMPACYAVPKFTTIKPASFTRTWLGSTSISLLLMAFCAQLYNHRLIDYPGGV